MRTFTLFLRDYVLYISNNQEETILYNFITRKQKMFEDTEPTGKITQCICMFKHQEYLIKRAILMFYIK